MTEFGEIFESNLSTMAFLYGSIALLVVQGLVAMWIVRRIHVRSRRTSSAIATRPIDDGRRRAS
jgi:hypothetical protein